MSPCFAYHNIAQININQRRNFLMTSFDIKFDPDLSFSVLEGTFSDFWYIIFSATRVPTQYQWCQSPYLTSLVDIIKIVLVVLTLAFTLAFSISNLLYSRLSSIVTIFFRDFVQYILTY